MKIKGYTKKLYERENKRNNKMKDLMHKISAFVVNFCKEKNISKLIVGYNKSWKTHINLGNKTNQIFTQIPFYKLLQMLNYKCKLIGCKLIETEESYTSKCDHLADEEMKHQTNYKGKRIKRGLFQSSIGKLINSDVNGALGIMKKVVDDHLVKDVINSGLLFNPVKIRDLFQMNKFKLLTNN
jgi:putative transposase